MRIGRWVRAAGWSVGLLGCLGCAAPQGSRAEPPAAIPQALETSGAPAQPTGWRFRTGTPLPLLTVVNDYPVVQHVFLDAAPLGTVTAGAAATFPVPAGVHAIVCADSADVDDNPTRVEESFDPGYGYVYRLTAE